MKLKLTAERIQLLFRLFLIGCQAVSILLTWNLWQFRTMPPLLPALPIPSFDMGAILLISLALVVIRPRTGLIVHSLLLFYAMLTDQTRIQPEFISITLLIWGTLPSVTTKTITRSHMIILWTWAGINKLLSPAFITSTGPAMMRAVFGFLPVWLIENAGYLIALTEIIIGITFMIPRTRRLSAILAFALHTGILITLVIGMRYNSAVWAWNLALAFAGFFYGWNWRDSPIVVVRAVRPLVRALMLFMLISPVGFYFGIFDAYLSHNLYSSNTANADAPVSPGMIMYALNVPMPPEHRLYEQFFRLTCTQRDFMVIRDPRPYFVANGLDSRILQCDSAGEGK